MATNMNLSKIKQTFGLGDDVQTPRLVTQLKQQYGLTRNNEFVPSTAAANANETTANNRTSENMQTKRGTLSNNPYLNRQGNLVNPYLNYQQLADDKRTNSRVKQFIREATGVTPTQSESTSESTIGMANNFGIEHANNTQTTDFSAWNAENLKNTDLTQLPKLSEDQISSLISKYFSKNGSVMSTSDAAGIYQAQAQSGISALALLGIGALESGYGTSNIARQKGNLWGWGAVNSNPMGGAKTFSSNAGNAAIEYAKNLKSLYYDQRGAKSIYAIGTGDNPSGLGYAYLDDEKTIDTRWPEQIGDIMAQFTKSLSGSKTVSDSGNSGNKGNQAVNIAKQFLGTPYVWGGESPDGFDCSGLMQYVYKKMGYDISRTTYTQIHDGTAVNKSNLQPGDLVFFGDASSPHHVGMYIGNGQYLHAPKTGDVVKISDLNARSDYAGARRIIQ